MGYNSIKFVLFLQTFFRLRRSVQENPAPAPLPQLPACIKGRLVRRSVMSVSFNSIFLYTSVLHRDKSRTHFYALGLSDGQPKVLNHLLRHEGVSQKELAEYCLVRPATMTALLRKMISDGLVYRQSLHAANGKRVFGIFLTDAGRELAEKVAQTLDTVSSLALKGFTEQEQEIFISYLQRMCENLENK
jgi:DNA-binding MarR family transcriptional regulator